MIPPLMGQKKRLLTLAPVRPSAGLEALYQRKIDTLVDEMCADVTATVRREYRANEPRMATDELGGLYVHRQLLNAHELHRWATDAGIPNIIPREKMHVTQVYSRRGIDLMPKSDGVVAWGGRRRITRLGDALVLTFRSADLTMRFDEAMVLGASWDFEGGYKPHVTLSYDPGDVDVSDLIPPSLVLIFGPEIHEPLRESWSTEEGLRMAADALPARSLNATMRRLARKWLRRFDQAAPEMAEYFATKATDRVDGSLEATLRKAGFTVRFQMTPMVRDIHAATVGENVSLIRSIPEQYLTQVEGMVMRSVSAGRDLHSLSKDLQQQFGVTRRRAETISRDQNNKATAVITRARYKELGIKQAIWLHSAGGKTPRPSHVAFSGQPFDMDKGAYIDGELIWPGTLINCRCVAKAIVAGLT